MDMEGHSDGTFCGRYRTDVPHRSPLRAASHPPAHRISGHLVRLTDPHRSFLPTAAVDQSITEVNSLYKEEE